MRHHGVYSESHRQDVVDERKHTREVSTHLNTGQPEKTTYSSASTAWDFPPRSWDFEVQLRIWGFFWKILGFLQSLRNYILRDVLKTTFVSLQ